MKSKYLFSFCASEISDETLFVIVYIGTSKQDQRDKAFFEQLAKQSTYYYFERYYTPQADYLGNLDAYFQATQNDTRARCLRCSMSAAKLRRLIKSGLYDHWAKTYYEATRGLRRMALGDNSAYHCAIYRADHSFALPRTY